MGGAGVGLQSTLSPVNLHSTMVCDINDLLFSIRTNHVVVLAVGAFLIQSGTYHAGIFCTIYIVVSYIIIYRR